MLPNLKTNSAVYTGIKKPEHSRIRVFRWKLRQLPLNTPKNPNRKSHLRSVIFWNSAEISLVFCQCKRSLQSRRYYSGFWSRDTWPSAESPDRGPRNAHYTYTVKGRERCSCAPLRFGFFRACAFRAKNPECLKTVQQKTQVFWILSFANVNIYCLKFMNIGCSFFP